MRRKAAFHNLGCKVNAYELEAMQQLMERAGYETVPFQPGADVYVINTCTVTNIADRKSRQMLHRAKKMNPDSVVAAVGCYAEVHRESLETDPAIDLIVGTGQKDRLPALLEEYFSSRRSDAAEKETGPGGSEVSAENIMPGGNAVPDGNAAAEGDTLWLTRTDSHTRAFLKVQDGCSQFCSYCIIPYARGRVRSRRISDVVREASGLADAGVREVVLTGIHLCSYGQDLPEGEKLPALIRAVHAVEGIRRIRLGSLEPGSMTEPFIAALAGLPKLCPHFHLSLQSGCDRTLRRMNRRYTSAEYEEACRLLRRSFQDPAITTDVIAGFPGETEEDFEASRAFVEKIGFFETHIFPYSRREGTRAAAFPDQLTEQEKRARCAVLRELNERNRAAYLQRWIGRPVEVLFEEQAEIGGRTAWTGHGREYQKAAVFTDENLENVIRTVFPQELSGEEYLICRF